MNSSNHLSATQETLAVARLPKAIMRRLALASRVLLCSSNGLEKVAGALYADKKHSTGEVLHSHQDLVVGDAAIQQENPTGEELNLGQRIVKKILGSIGNSLNSSETAVISIGDQITSLFDIAVNNNDAVTKSLRNVVGHDDPDQIIDEDDLENQTIGELIERQRYRIDQFVAKAESYFQEQSANTEESWSRFEQVENRISEIASIAGNSKVLAINAKIESARLGTRGAAFAVVSNHLSVFSDDIQHANNNIVSSLKLMRESMQQSRDAAQKIETELGSFSKNLVDEVARVEEQTQSMTQAMTTTLAQINESGNQMIDHSRTALSELQFHDPMVQELKRTEHEVLKLLSLLETGMCEDTDLAELDDEVGRDGRLEREAGEVDLF